MEVLSLYSPDLDQRMTVIFRPIGMLKSYIGDQEETSVEAGVSIRDTMLKFGMPPEIAALVLVNDEQQSKDYILLEGDVIRVIAVMGGG